MPDELDDFIEGELPKAEPLPPPGANPQAVEEAVEEIPPEPPLRVERNKFGPGAHGVYLPDGTPVGVWMRENNVTPRTVEQYLTERGLDPKLVADFVRQREGGIEADRLLNQEPAVQQNQVMLDKHDAQTEALRAAFIKAKKEKT